MATITELQRSFVEQNRGTDSVSFVKANAKAEALKTVKNPLSFLQTVVTMAGNEGMEKLSSLRTNTIATLLISQGTVTKASTLPILSKDSVVVEGTDVYEPEQLAVLLAAKLKEQSFFWETQADILAAYKRVLTTTETNAANKAKGISGVVEMTKRHKGTWSAEQMQADLRKGVSPVAVAAYTEFISAECLVYLAKQKESGNAAIA